LSYDDFKWKVKNAYPDADISFPSNGAQHLAKVANGDLTLFKSAENEAIYGMMNGVSIGRCLGIE
jgi:hypothetical protein